MSTVHALCGVAPALHPTTFRVLNAIDTYIGRHEWPPSHKDIMQIIGSNSVSHVAHHLRRLVSVGCIRHGHGARMIALTDKGRAALRDGE